MFKTFSLDSKSLFLATAFATLTLNVVPHAHAAGSDRDKIPGLTFIAEPTASLMPSERADQANHCYALAYAEMVSGFIDQSDLLKELEIGQKEAPSLELIARLHTLIVPSNAPKAEGRALQAHVTYHLADMNEPAEKRSLEKRTVASEKLIATGPAVVVSAGDIMTSPDCKPVAKMNVNEFSREAVRQFAQRALEIRGEYLQQK